MSSVHITHQIRELAIKKLADRPEGMRWTELNAALLASGNNFHSKTVNGCIWKLPVTDSGKVYKAEKGIYRHTKFRSSR